MTKYKASAISGDAGEYFVAYTVTKSLGWPFRLSGVDLGVDGEIELLNEDGISHGDIIKVQVKSISKLPTKGRNIKISDDHINYWKNFSAPVIICCVDHRTQNIYWKPVYQTEEYLSEKGSRSIRFDSGCKKLNSSSKKDLRDLITPEGAKNISTKMAELKNFIETVKFHAAGDYDYYEKRQADAAKIKEDAMKLLDKKSLFPWKFSPLDVRLINEAYQLALRDYHECKKEMIELTC